MRLRLLILPLALLLSFTKSTHLNTTASLAPRGLRWPWKTPVCAPKPWWYEYPLYPEWLVRFGVYNLVPGYFEDTGTIRKPDREWDEILFVLAYQKKYYKTVALGSRRVMCTWARCKRSWDLGNRDISQYSIPDGFLCCKSLMDRLFCRDMKWKPAKPEKEDPPAPSEPNKPELDHGKRLPVEEGKWGDEEGVDNNPYEAPIVTIIDHNHNGRDDRYENGDRGPGNDDGQDYYGDDWGDRSYPKDPEDPVRGEGGTSSSSSEGARTSSQRPSLCAWCHNPISPTHAPTPTFN